MSETKCHVANNSGNNEWYTPPQFIESARTVMTSIDIDPASNDVAQQTVKANNYYTFESTGLDKDWLGNVWMNPPYSASLIKQFSNRLVEQVVCGNTKQFVVLVNNATETGWFRQMLSVSDAVCLITKRVKFLDPTGKPVGAPLQGQAVLYHGQNPREFANEFSQYGVICKVMTHKISK